MVIHQVEEGGGRNLVEKWDGSSWTEVAELGSATYGAVSSGTSTAAIVYGGSNPAIALNQAWNGSSWTELADLNTARRRAGGGGTSNTAAMIFGGTPPGTTAVTEVWDGSSWTEVSDLNELEESGLGEQQVLPHLLISFWWNMFQELPPHVIKASTEQWDGTSWTEVLDMATARSDITGCGADGQKCFSVGGTQGGGFS